MLAGLLGGSDEGEATGRILVDDRAPEGQRGRIGLVLQDPEAGIVLSKVGDDVAFGCENLGVPAADIPARVAEAVASVGLSVPLDRPTKALSGGQKQRLGLAGVLAIGPGRPAERRDRQPRPQVSWRGRLRVCTCTPMSRQ